MPKQSKEKIQKPSVQRNEDEIEKLVDKNVNIVMVGDDGIGKTSIIDSYIYDTFS